MDVLFSEIYGRELCLGIERQMEKVRGREHGSERECAGICSALNDAR